VGFFKALFGLERWRRRRRGACGGELERDSGEHCGAGEGFEVGESGGFGVSPDGEARGM